MRRKLSAGLIAVVLLGACAPQETSYSIPRCGDVSDALILEAQSVPTAAKIPCLGPLPEGWTKGEFEARDGSTEFVLDSDRAGISAVEVTLADSCNFARAGEVPTDEPGTRKWTRIGDLEVEDTDVDYYVFSGGCVQYEFDFEGPGRSELLLEIEGALSFVDRSRIADEIEGLGLRLDP